MQVIQDIRDKFFELKQTEQYVTDKSGCKMLEVIGESFTCDENTIFGELNHDYIKKELEWYNSLSLNVNDIPGGPPKIWEQVSDVHGYINSNYGWCIFSGENGYQYNNVLETLKSKPDSRQAVMIYTRPTMHEDAIENGRSDFMCTNAVQYMIRDEVLQVIVQMRSNDVIFGFRNDFAWQDYVAKQLQEVLGLKGRNITWNVGSLHVYERHFDYVKPEMGPQLPLFS